MNDTHRKSVASQFWDPGIPVPVCSLRIVAAMFRTHAPAKKELMLMTPVWHTGCNGYLNHATAPLQFGRRPVLHHNPDPFNLN